MSKCPLCSNESTQVLSSQLRRGNGSVHYCPICEYGFLQPEYSDTKKYYNEEYRKKFMDVLTEEEESPLQIYEMRKNYQTDRLNIVAPYFSRNKRFMEIGSSAGQFLECIANEFKEIVGIELSNSCAEFVERKLGIKVYTDSLENIQWDAEDKFHYIGFFQVLEHIHNPVEFMQNVKRRLTSDGKIFIEVPNLYDPLRKLWSIPAYEKFFYHEAHLSYFTEKSLGKLLEMAGFEIEETIYLQDYNILNHLFWYFNDKPQNECTFGLNQPHINFTNKKCGEEVNRLLVKMNEEYFKILQRNKLTSNMMIVAHICNK